MITTSQQHQKKYQPSVRFRCLLQKYRDRRVINNVIRTMHDIIVMLNGNNPFPMSKKLSTSNGRYIRMNTMNDNGNIRT